MNTLTEALRLYQDGQYQEAARRLRIFVEFDRTNPQAWMYYGAALGQLGRWHEAAEAYRKVVNLHPDEVSSHCDLAAALIETGQLDQAETALSAALAVEPRHPIAMELQERLRRRIPAPPPPAPKTVSDTVSEETVSDTVSGGAARPAPSRLRLLLVVLALLLVITAVQVARLPGEKWRRLDRAATLLDEADEERRKLAGYPGEDFGAVQRIEARHDQAAEALRWVATHSPPLPETAILQARLIWSQDRDRLAAEDRLFRALGLLRELPAQRRRRSGYRADELAGQAYRMLSIIELASAAGPEADRRLFRARQYLNQARAADPGQDYGDLERALQAAGRRR